MRLNPHPPRRPPGGFIYNDPSGVDLTEPDYPEKLVEKLRQFRLNNNLSPGDPEHDIALQFSVKGWGYLLLQEHQSQPEPATPKHSDALVAISAWVSKLWRDPPKTILPPKDTIAAKRISICDSCPKFKNWRPDLNQNDGAEGYVTLRKLIVLSKGNQIADGYCSHHKWHAGLACLIPEPQSAAPHLKGCWHGQNQPWDGREA